MKPSEKDLRMQLALVDRGISLFLKKDIAANGRKDVQNESNVLVNIFMGADDVSHQKWEVMVQGSSLGELLSKTVSINEEFIDRSNFSLDELIKVREQTVSQLQLQAKAPPAALSKKYSRRPQGENSVRLTRLDLEFLDLGIKVLQQEQDPAENENVMVAPGLGRNFMDDGQVVCVIQIAWIIYQALRSGSDVSRETLVMQRLLSAGLTDKGSLDQLIAARDEMAAQLND